METLNKDLRRKIVDMVVAGKDGHIPSAFSILDIIEVIYREHLTFRPEDPEWEGRDIFVLSKGHGCLAQYVVMGKHGILTDTHLDEFCTCQGLLGEHPDCTKVPGSEASTGSLGHGMPFAVGIAMALKIRGMNNKVYVVCGDGECQEGTIWEAANIANNQQLGNLCVVVDWNGSAAQLQSRDDLPGKWKAFGWDTTVCEGHSEEELNAAIKGANMSIDGAPKAIIAKTTKGKGVPMLEGHGPWHHRIPNEEEYKIIMEALS